MKKQFNIALIGNPNCGKTTIFNNLTGARQKVGNWPGVTVEKKTGQYTYDDQRVAITDLPGIYSLSPAPQNNSIDQKITNEFISCEQNIDLYINILDATNLKRNLYLCLQLISLGLPCIIVINMIDKTGAKNLNIDYQKLSSILNCPVIAISSTYNSKENSTRLKQAIYQKLQSKQTNNKSPLFNHANIANNLGLNLDLNLEVNQAVNNNHIQNISVENNNYNKLNEIILEYIKHFEQTNTSISRDMHRDLAPFGYILQLLETESDNTNHELNFIKKQIADHYQEDTDIIIADLRYNLINNIYKKSIQNSPLSADQTSSTHNKTAKLDTVILNKYLGIPIFLFILYSIFEISISLGEVLKPFFELPSQALTEYFIAITSNTLGLSVNLSQNISQGLATGISTVAGFIPQIGLMFILLTFLEDSGYMARAAFVMDRLMQSAGLPGKSFVPLIISFGCNVPAILSTRTLDSPRDRILTCLMSPFMSCSARLAIFIVFASAFFPKHQGLMVFLLYITGILVAILTGLLVKSTILTNKAMPFILELPSYNVPTVKNILITTWQRCKGFITRAGKLIIPICLVLQLLNSIQPNGQWITDDSHLDKSLLAKAGKTITPILNPIGVTNDNWPATVGLITGSLAKEVVVGTLNTIYSSTNNLNTPNIEDNISNQEITDTSNIVLSLKLAYTESLERLARLFSKQHYEIEIPEDSEFSSTAFIKLSHAFPSTWAAFAYCLFVLLYMPCLSTFSILMREIGKNWAIASLLWSLDIAYITSSVVYQLSNLQNTPVKSLSIISLIITSHLLIYRYLKSGKLNNYFKINEYHGHSTTA